MPVYDLNVLHADVTTGFIAESSKTLRGSLARIEHCVRQLSDEEVWWRPREEMNAIGNLVLHLCGNVEQWVIAPITNRAADRDRPAEFTAREQIPAVELLARLTGIVDRAAAGIESLPTSVALLQPRRIQGHDTNLLTAIYHCVTHFEGHAQEIISMTRQIKGPAYQFLWMPSSPEQASAAG